MVMSAHMQRLREEIQREQQARYVLPDHMKVLESQLQRLQMLPSPLEDIHQDQEPTEPREENAFQEDYPFEGNQSPPDGGVAAFPGPFNL